jgi:hypothetical protein
MSPDDRQRWESTVRTTRGSRNGPAPPWTWAFGPEICYLVATAALISGLYSRCHLIERNPALSSDFVAVRLYEPFHEYRQKQYRELIDEHEPSLGLQNANALEEIGALVGPVVEGGRGHDEIERAVGEREILGTDTADEPEPIVRR